VVRRKGGLADPLASGIHDLRPWLSVIVDDAHAPGHENALSQPHGMHVVEGACELDEHIDDGPLVGLRQKLDKRWAVDDLPCDVGASDLCREANVVDCC
jgi:hypothetical protein